MRKLLSKIMKKAWEIKRQDKRNVFSECLKMAWAFYKKTRLTVKEWFAEKIQREASRYDMWIDFEYKNGQSNMENGLVTIKVFEKLAETEKAIKVKLETGYVVGSVKGWTTWIPKSVIK